MIKKNKGFSLIEIIISLAILAIVFSFMFYFISSINKKISIKNEKPFMLNNYNYSDKYCDLPESVSLLENIDLSDFISTSTPITSLNIFHKNNLVITTNSSSTTEPDIFIFSMNYTENIPTLNLLKSIDTGPGINDALSHNDLLYVLNTSVNSHLQTFKINIDYTFTLLKDIKIHELSLSYSLAKNIYLYDKKILIGSEKNNLGGELFVFSLNQDNIPQNITKSVEINGQVNDIYENDNLIYIANASDIELYVYDKDLSVINTYDAPLSSGNGKSVYYLYPHIYLGRTISSFETFFLFYKDNIMQFIKKNKTNGSIDFIQDVGNQLLFIVNSEDKELQFYSKDLQNIKNINLSARVSTFICFDKNILFATTINNKTNIIWLK